MAKLTLDQVWRKCMPMWRGIGELIKANPDAHVSDLKLEWLGANDPGAHLIQNCYFCQYAGTDGGGYLARCGGCPGRKIDPDFFCLREGCSFDGEPLAFLAKLESLYVKYEAAKKRASKKRRAKA